ncbi:MAG: histidinol-phosphate transaminase [Alphaproteobacteria bacterium]|nr:MAG: histidinol-phosphate transaminase [Alphaproteobacteria bacterium]
MTSPAPKPGILEIAAYVGGKSKAAPGVTPIKLSSNEGALGPSPKAMAAFTAAAPDLHRYPDGGAIALRAAIARRYGLEADRIVCGAGSDELIALLTKAYAGPGDEVLYSQHGFLMYPIAAKSVGATPIAVPEQNLTADIDGLLAAVTPNTRILFLANPNNPTGTLLPAEAVRRLHAGLPASVLLVLDAAYAEYVDRNDYDPGIGLVQAADNVVMLRTFSKIYALAALRLGWAYCPPAIADVLNRLRGPFNTGLAAQAAGVAAMEDQAFVDAVKAHNDIWRPWLAQELAAAGLSVVPSVANFLLVRFPGGAAAAAACYRFLEARGLIVREMGGYGLGDCLRITVGTEAECRAVAAGITAFCTEQSTTAAAGSAA